MAKYNCSFSFGIGRSGVPLVCSRYFTKRQAHGNSHNTVRSDNFAEHFILFSFLLVVIYINHVFRMERFKPLMPGSLSGSLSVLFLNEERIVIWPNG